jgi:hypothetical protein
MQVSNIIKPTESVDADGKKVDVESLPKNIRYEIETLDRYKQKRMENLSEGEMLDHAIRSITLNISQLVRDHLKKEEASQEKVNEPKPESV